MRRVDSRMGLFASFKDWRAHQAPGPWHPAPPPYARCLLQSPGPTPPAARFHSLSLEATAALYGQKPLRRSLTSRGRHAHRPRVCACAWTRHGMGRGHASLSNNCSDRRTRSMRDSSFWEKRQLRPPTSRQPDTRNQKKLKRLDVDSNVIFMCP